jgi:hypothetical protein
MDNEGHVELPPAGPAAPLRPRRALLRPALPPLESDQPADAATALRRRCWGELSEVLSIEPELSEHPLDVPPIVIVIASGLLVAGFLTLGNWSGGLGLVLGAMLLPLIALALSGWRDSRTVAVSAERLLLDTWTREYELVSQRLATSALALDVLDDVRWEAVVAALPLPVRELLPGASQRFADRLLAAAALGGRLEQLHVDTSTGNLALLAEIGRELLVLHNLARSSAEAPGSLALRLETTLLARFCAFYDFFHDADGE